jgi:hypothetical protein
MQAAGRGEIDFGGVLVKRCVPDVHVREADVVVVGRLPGLKPACVYCVDGR